MRTPGGADEHVLLEVSSGAVVADRVEIASTWWRRLRGLLGRSALRPGEALVLVPCSSIHTLGMRFSIDVVFLDSYWRIRCLAESVSPWRVGPICPGARYVIELPAGTIARCRLTRGQLLRLVPNEGSCERDDAVSP
ncbi:DUF192 domain-containing protein [Thermomicrobium sp. 4228-Ro]|uniref:DUF192 domain-containing protein n=1 Tax=Thermomicrobium sp. 4228-Ro TaxID=2993937 RepID=UPI003A4C5EE1